MMDENLGLRKLVLIEICRERERNGRTERDRNRERGQKTSSKPNRERKRKKEKERERERETSKKNEVTPRGKLGWLLLLSLPVFLDT